MRGLLLVKGENQSFVRSTELVERKAASKGQAEIWSRVIQRRGAQAWRRRAPSVTGFEP
ncbi:protein of unknown function (plasmid) [Nitratireductor aquimarinus]